MNEANVRPDFCKRCNVLLQREQVQLLDDYWYHLCWYFSAKSLATESYKCWGPFHYSGEEQPMRAPTQWHAFPYEDGRWGIYTRHTPPMTGVPIELTVENANTLSAAKDMKEALEAVVEQVGHFSDAAVHKAWLALNRANGL